MKWTPELRAKFLSTCESVLEKIKNGDHFENNRARELKSMAWVPLPNKMDGDGYTEPVTHPGGAAHFGACVCR